MVTVGRLGVTSLLTGEACRFGSLTSQEQLGFSRLLTPLAYSLPTWVGTFMLVTNRTHVLHGKSTVFMLSNISPTVSGIRRGAAHRQKQGGASSLSDFDLP
jgi:hypothetical protein